jgi:hypothetical protein
VCVFSMFLLVFCIQCKNLVQDGTGLSSSYLSRSKFATNLLMIYLFFFNEFFGLDFSRVQNLQSPGDWELDWKSTRPGTGLELETGQQCLMRSLRTQLKTLPGTRPELESGQHAGEATCWWLTILKAPIETFQQVFSNLQPAYVCRSLSFDTTSTYASFWFQYFKVSQF